MSQFRLVENVFYGSNGTSLFQTAAFFKLHAQPGASYFELCQNDKVKACVHFTPVSCEGNWRSPAKGTFSGITFDASLKQSELDSFLDGVESSLRSKGATNLEILLAPQSHDETAFARQVYLLRSRGFETTRCDLNQSLRIDERSLSERMSYGNLKRLRKCGRDGLVARSLPLSELPRVYETLAINRASKGHSLSMTLAQLELMADTFPRDVILFGCPGGNRFAAAAVCLRLTPALLYVFYWGDRPEFSSHSPVVAIADAIYRYGQEHDYSLIDVGTSTIDRVANFGLLEFKRSLGFDESLKVTMQKAL